MQLADPASFGSIALMNYLSKWARILHTMGPQLSSSLNSIPAERTATIIFGMKPTQCLTDLQISKGQSCGWLLSVLWSPSRDLSKVLWGSQFEELLRVTRGQPLCQNLLMNFCLQEFSSQARATPKFNLEDIAGHFFTRYFFHCLLLSEFCNHTCDL